ncbi:17252_t:CDS:1, partial [Gigaspora margarita]
QTNQAESKKPDKPQQRKTRPIQKEKKLYLVYIETRTGHNYTKERSDKD